MQLIEKIIEEHGPFRSVLDVGSFDVNGSIRAYFKDIEEYIGVDFREGGNVDRVVNGHELAAVFGPDKFDLVVCFDTFEHDDAFWLTVENIKQVVKPGGWVVLGMPGRNCPEHDHPHDYWRFMPQSGRLLLDGFIDVEVDIQTDDHNHRYEDEIYVWGRKPK